MDALLFNAYHKVGLTWDPCSHNPNHNSKHHPAWFDDARWVAQCAVWAAVWEHGHHAGLALAAHRAFCQACCSAACAARTQLPHQLKECPANFWLLLSPPCALVGAMVEELAAQFDAFLYCQDVEAPVAPAVVPLNPPLTGLEL